ARPRARTRLARAWRLPDVWSFPASAGSHPGGDRATLAGQGSAIHLACWSTNDMQIKRSAAMVINWPVIVTRSFDFAPFTRKDKPYTEAKQEYERQVNQLTDVLDNARHYAQAMGHGGPSDFERDVKLEALVPVVRGQL